MSTSRDPVRDVGQYGKSIAVLAGAAAVCLVFRAHLNPTDIAMLLLLADVVVASRYPLGPALFTSIVSIALFDFAFIEPYYTFDVHDKAYFLTFMVMLVVALVMSRLTGHIRQQAAMAGEREERTAALFRLSQDLGSVGGAEGVIGVATRHIGQVTGTTPVLIRADADGHITQWPPHPLFQDLDIRVAAGWALETGHLAGRGTDQGAAADAFVVPLRTPSRSLGIALVPVALGTEFTTSQRETITALADEVSRALERTVLAERHEAARVEVEAERLRTALLSSLSHDLRSPLGSIEGAASLLLGSQALGDDTRRELASAILDESRRMTRLVSNLLDMIRVETHSLAVTKEWQPLEESLGVALMRLEERLKSHPVDVALPQGLPLVAADELLLEQVFINLLENAAKYTPSGTSITVSAWDENDAVVVEVADRGPGLAQEQLESVFHKFYRVPGNTPGNGAGLGLTICRGIIVAHGGRIWAEQRNGGGTAFRFTLPLSGPSVPPPPDAVLESADL